MLPAGFPDRVETGVTGQFSDSVEIGVTGWFPDRVDSCVTDKVSRQGG